MNFVFSSSFSLSDFFRPSSIPDRIGSNYTLAFESFLFVLARELSSDKISNLVLEEDDSITKVLQAVM